jgi:hypothetical protein
MNHAQLAHNLETFRQDNDGPPLPSRKCRIEWARRLSFLELSARYLGQTLSARQLHSLARRIDK